MEFAWPKIVECEWFGRNAEYIPVESSEYDNSSQSKMVRKALDTKAGIDGWIINDLGVIGAGIRVQWMFTGDYFRTLTVRRMRTTDAGEDTELKKRREAKNYYVRPGVCIHAYVNNDPRQLNYICACYADELFQSAVDEKIVSYDQRFKVQFTPWDDYRQYGWLGYEDKNRDDGNVFVVFPVDALIGNNIHLREWSATNGLHSKVGEFDPSVSPILGTQLTLRELPSPRDEAIEHLRWMCRSEEEISP